MLRCFPLVPEFCGGVPMTGPVAPKNDGRDESLAERMDRNWVELLQELRVLQTGVQILAGFLLTLPFQSRFETLDDYQTRLYLANVVLAALTTATILLSVGTTSLIFDVTVGRTAGVIAGVGLLAVLVLLLVLVPAWIRRRARKEESL